jgi:hypothetical protein
MKQYNLRWERFATQYPAICVGSNYQKTNHNVLTHVPTGDEFYIVGCNYYKYLFCFPDQLDHLSHDDKDALEFFLSEVWIRTLKQEEPQRLQQLSEAKVVAMKRYS